MPIGRLTLLAHGLLSQTRTVSRWSLRQLTAKADVLLPDGVDANSGSQSGWDRVWAYHRLSSHHADAFAPGPTHVDWATQPSPYRRFDGAPRQHLPTDLARTDVTYADLFDQSKHRPEPLSLAAVSQLVALSFGISGWKSQGGETWAVRCNPSSGNLHPTEAYVLASGVQGLEDGFYHYDVQRHALERRADTKVSARGLWIGLSSVVARETWKYGVRAFRYTQLDVGHAMGAVAFAAATLGWRVVPVAVEHHELVNLFGTARPEYGNRADLEEPEVLLRIETEGSCPAQWSNVATTQWYGQPSRVGDTPPKPWSAVDDVIAATRGSAPLPVANAPLGSGHQPKPHLKAVDVIRSRRSARRFTSKSPPSWPTIRDILHARHLNTGPLGQMVPDGRVETLVAIHKVAGLEPGLYALPPTDGGQSLCRDLCVDAATTGTQDITQGLLQIKAGDHRAALRKLACQQGVASEGAATVIMFADLDTELGQHPSHYRDLHREAGLIGQALYLEATARGLGATGIGCFLDAELRSLFVKPHSGWWPIYAFGIGQARPDPNALVAPATMPTELG